MKAQLVKAQPVTMQPLAIARPLAATLFAVGNFFAVQSSHAACPELSWNNPLGDLTEFRGYPNWVYFCQQKFTTEQRTAVIRPKELVGTVEEAGSPVYGRLSIPSGSFSKIDDIGVGTIVIDPKATFSSLPFKGKITKKLPSFGKRYNGQNIFNFYSKVGRYTNCWNNWGTNEYEYLKKYLRNKSHLLFKAQTPGEALQSATVITSGADIAVIKNLKLKNSSGQTLIGNLYFTESSKNWFTRGWDKFCWLGIKTRLEINPNSHPVNGSGNYGVNIQIHKP